jgi:cytochrome oxidase Cu insertion factor (SCO1/SenC/PrrC family)
LYDVPPAAREQLGDGVYAMRHLDQVLVFGPDGVARYAYAPGTRPSALAADLTRLTSS